MTYEEEIMNKVAKIKKAAPKEFGCKMNMRYGLEKRVSDYLFKMNMHYLKLVRSYDALGDLITGCDPSDLVSEFNRSLDKAVEFKARLIGVVEGLRLSGMRISLVEDTRVRGLPMYNIELED